MGTDNAPLISIVMAVYKPNEKWFREQLRSLNEQTYPSPELLVCDDCPDFPVDEKIISENIVNFPYVLVRNEKNMGSNKAFERLTELANGKYIAYCDQDDVWHGDKLEKMCAVLERTGSPLVCSDFRVIDGGGELIADSITKVRKRHVFCEGDGLAPQLLVRNFVTGCAMMIRSDVAKAAVPFADSLVHDQWLAINAALCGRIEVIRKPLIDYRQHGNNQTGVLKDITDKQSYYHERLVKFMARIRDYKQRLYGKLGREIDGLEEFYSARIRYSEKANMRDLGIMRKYRETAPKNVLLETVMPFLPNFMFKWALSLARKGKL